jgi:hypothetical protein
MEVELVLQISSHREMFFDGGGVLESSS